jgi:hypothetical protein
MYATPNDLNRFLRGLLNNELLSSTDLATWLKPTSFSPTSKNEAIGMPWTIRTPTNVLSPESGDRPVEIFLMPGGQGYYNGYVGVIPEYQLGYSVNVAGVGDDPALRALMDYIVRYSVPHYDSIRREQAKENYAGRYGSGGSALELVVDDGPGLKVETWTTGGKAVKDAWVEFFGSDAQNAIDAEVRLYPVGADNRWRASFKSISETNSTGTIFEDSCYTWFTAGAWLYGGLNVDEIDFTLGEDGKAIEAVSPGLRQTMTREV